MKWKWSSEQQRAFEEIKKAFQSCVTLKYPIINEPYLLRCDASGLAVAAILSQVDDQGEESIIEITRRCLNEIEKRYSTTEKELLAILHAVKNWRHYLFGNQIIVKTDHHALTFLNKGTGLNARMVRWAIALGEFDLQIEYIKGKENIAADFLSRINTIGNDVLEDHNFLVGTEKLKTITNSRNNKAGNQEEDVEIAQVGIIDEKIMVKKKLMLDNDGKTNDKGGMMFKHSKWWINSREGEWRSKKKWKEKGQVLNTIVE